MDAILRVNNRGFSSTLLIVGVVFACSSLIVRASPAVNASPLGSNQNVRSVAGCFFWPNNKTYTVGEKWPVKPPFECAMLTCSGPNSFSAVPCATESPSSDDCKEVPGDSNAYYPGCCPRYECPEDGAVPENGANALNRGVTDAPNGAAGNAPNGSPTDAPNGVPANALSGSPANALNGSPAQDLYGVQADAPYGVQADAPYNTQADILYGFQSDAPDGALADAPYGVQANAPYNTQADILYDVQSDAPNNAQANAPYGAQNNVPNDADADVYGWYKGKRYPTKAGKVRIHVTEESSPPTYPTFQTDLSALQHKRNRKLQLADDWLRLIRQESLFYF